MMFFQQFCKSGYEVKQVVSVILGYSITLGSPRLQLSASLKPVTGFKQLEAVWKFYSLIVILVLKTTKTLKRSIHHFT